jgi:MFS family permease
MVVGQVTMVMLMVITSLHMQDHHHNLNDIGFVISSHTVGMFAFRFSPVAADRWGRTPVIIFGAMTLILACISSTFRQT